MRWIPLLLISGLAHSAGVTDFSSRRPTAVTFPSAGGSYVDPVFGSKIIRVTDEDDGRLCAAAYAYWPAFNLDGTRLLIACDDVPLLYRFDRNSDTITPDGLLWGNDGPPIDFSGAYWSNLDPDIIYGLEGTRLWKVDVSRRGRQGYELVHDFAGLFTYRHEMKQLQMDGRDRVFTFHSRDGSTKLDAVAYDRQTNQTWVFKRGDRAIDETKIDKLGRYVIVDNAKPTYGWHLWDFRNGTSEEFQRSDPDDKPGGHLDMGGTFIANSDGFTTGILVREYGELHGSGIRNIVQYKRPDGSLNWTIADHVSLRSDAEDFVVVSTYAGDGTYGAFEDEIFLVYTDGSGFVRLGHTRSAQKFSDSGWNYFAEPRAVVDRAGRYIVYSSDLGSTSHIDVMMLKIPAAYVVDNTGGGEPDAGVVDPGELDAGVVEPGDPDAGTVIQPGSPDAGVKNPGHFDAGRRPPGRGPITKGEISGGCSVGGSGGASWWLLLLVALLPLRRRRSPTAAPTRR
jgi:MYXO-CTERM domain-containing protein